MRSASRIEIRQQLNILHSVTISREFSWENYGERSLQQDNPFDLVSTESISLN
eukprot:m.170039 g.170039  ORF g.170039 m.170039 type:complete len:53 (+) comp18254_c0_seq2:587-745(+)